jgi:hypothetical protein
MDIVEKLDEIFSIFTRLRFADYRGMVHCYTCPWFGYWKECDCGHWIKRSNHAVRWNKDNARPQCKSCNEFEDGKPEVFEQELREEIGDEAVDELEVIAIKDRYLSKQEMEEQLIHYRSLVKEIGDKL